jgi:hypothetical protein
VHTGAVLPKHLSGRHAFEKNKKQKWEVIEIMPRH